MWRMAVLKGLGQGVALVLVLLALSSAALGGVIERVSVDSAGFEGNDWSGRPSISANGRFVAFSSPATNLVPDDTNFGVDDIFLHDRKTGLTERVSVEAAGTEGSDWSFQPSISANGRFVAFWSYADLVPGDGNFHPDVFVYDRRTGLTERVSGDATSEGHHPSSAPSISANGRLVAFESHANASDTQIDVHDRRTGLTERVSVDAAGIEGNGSSSAPSISANGRFVAFWSWASNLVPDDTTFTYDIFVHDRRTGLSERVSWGDAGAPASISANGRFVAFEHFVGASFRDHIFVHDRKTGLSERVSVDSAGADGNGDSYGPSISANGRFVAFTSYASNLVSDDTNFTEDIFVHDRRTGLTERLSVDSAGAEGNNYSFQPSVSANGRFVAFTSGATNLVPDDTNSLEDIFVHDRK